MPGVQIRRIRSDEWEALRDIRLRALLDTPDAFGSTHEQEAVDPEDAWRDWTANGAEGGDGFTAVALDGGAWIGLAVGAPHRAFPGEVGLFAMWVDPVFRGQGIGRRLVDEVVAWARTAGFPSIRLLATTTNDAAIRLYDRCGFVDSGERQPLRDGAVIVAMTMTLALT